MADVALPGAAGSGGGQHALSQHDDGGSSADDGVPSRNRPRRKATEKPNGTDAQRQSFSKRKKGIAAKAYQLSRLTDAKVAVFVVNEKGSSWAYASPGFGAAVSPAYLGLMRKLADLPAAPKVVTEVMPHPDNTHGAIDDRELWEANVHPALQQATSAYGHQPTMMPSMYKLPTVGHSSGLGVSLLPTPTFTSTGQTIGHPSGTLVSQPLELAGTSTVHQPQQQHLMSAVTHVQPMYSVPFQQSTGGLMSQPSHVLPGCISTGMQSQNVQGPQVTGVVPELEGVGRKRAAGKAADEGAAKEGRYGVGQGLQRPPVNLTRQHAIIPAVAPPPEGLFGKFQH